MKILLNLPDDEDSKHLKSILTDEARIEISTGKNNITITCNGVHSNPNKMQ